MRNKPVLLANCRHSRNVKYPLSVTLVKFAIHEAFEMSMVVKSLSIPSQRLKETHTDLIGPSTEAESSTTLAKDR